MVQARNDANRTQYAERGAETVICKTVPRAAERFKHLAMWQQVRGGLFGTSSVLFQVASTRIELMKRNRFVSSSWRQISP